MSDALGADAMGFRDFRPSWPAFHRRLARRMLLLGPLVVVIVLVASWPSLGLAFMMLGASLTVGGIVLAVYFGRARVRVEGTTVHVRGSFRSRSWSRTDIAALVLVPQPGLSAGPGAPAATLYAVSPAHERLFWLSGDFWERTELDEVAAAIAVPVVAVPKGLLAEEIRQRYPGTVGWTAVHPWLFALLVAGVASAVMLVSIVITSAVLIATGELQLPSPAN